MQYTLAVIAVVVAVIFYFYFKVRYCILYTLLPTCGDYRMFGLCRYIGTASKIYKIVIFGRDRETSFSLLKFYIC